MKVRLFSLLLSVLLLVGVGPGVSAGDAADPVRVDLKVLIIANGTSNPSLGAWTALLDREGVPFDVFDPLAADLTAGDLSSEDHAFYQGVVCATSCIGDLGWASPELAVLDAYQAEFGIRRVNAFAYPGGIFGLSDGEPGQEVGGDLLSVTAAGSAVFPYLDGPVPVDTFTWGVYATVVNTGIHESLVSGPGGASVIGISQNVGFEEMVMTIDSNQYQSHALLLGHGMLNWVTRGIFLGYNRNYFEAHFDDIFLPDDRWDPVSNTTPEDDGATVPLIRMVPRDVKRALQWQADTGIRLDMVYNGAGSYEEIANNGSDALTDAFVSVKDSFYWINHTFEHLNLDTVSQAAIESDIATNLEWAAKYGIPVDPTELVTGEHSGLGNPAMPAALTNQGIEWVAADNSRQPTPYTLGSAVTVPRYPANVFYNVATEEGQLDEYNFIYNINQGCENTPTTTCNDRDLTWDEYVDAEATIMLPHMMINDPRPHYFHQSNLAEEGIFYTVFGEVLDRYNGFFEVELIQPTMRESAQIMARAAAWDSTKDSITAYIEDGAVHLTSPTRVMAPITGTPVGSLYGGERSGWVPIGPTETVIQFSDVAGPTTLSPTLAPSPSNGTVDVAIYAIGDDTTTGGSDIIAAEYFIDAVGADGSGSPLAVGSPAPTAKIGGVISAATVSALADGSHVVSVHSQDSAGNWGAPATVDLTVDSSAPVVTGVVASPNPTAGTTTVTLSATADDAGTGVAAAEWFTGDADPGVGNGTPMRTSSSGPWSLAASIDVTGWADANYQLNVRAQDAVGNWSDPVSAILTVEAPPSQFQGLNFSTYGNTALPNLGGTADNADIYAWDDVAYSRLFDAAGTGSAGLPSRANVDAYSRVDDTHFYMSFSGWSTWVPGLGRVQDEDVVYYNNGVWEMFFDGTAQGLTRFGHDVDAIDIVGDVLFFSTTGNGAIPGVSGLNDDADIYSWDGTSFSRVWDASVAGLPGTADVDGLVMVDDAHFYLSFKSTSTTIPILGGVADVSVAYNDGGTWSVFFDGTANGLAAGTRHDLDAIDIP